MQRWFFLDDHKRSKLQSPTKKMSVNKEQKVNEVLFQQWAFSVKVPEIFAKEKVFLTGDIPDLGEWDVDKCVPMEYDQSTELWTKTVIIPNTCDVLYRYVIFGMIEDSNQMFVRRWETQLKPRVISPNLLHPTIDTFGDYEGKSKVGRGWLTCQSLVQFKFIKNPLKLKSRKAGKSMNIKITPVKISFGMEPTIEDSSLSTDTIESPDTPQGVYVEVSTLNNNPAICSLQPQDQFGREYKPDDVLLINVYAPDPKNIAYLIDFYYYSTRGSSDDPPCHVGYTYVLPNMFKPSEGSLELPVTCNVKHRPLGTIAIEYIIVKPMPEELCTFKVSYANHWNPSWTGLEVGHRGLGASFKTKGNPIRENTIASLKKAAASGADMLEFDVQLSKDMIPVIYHDFYICISMKRKKEVDYSEMLELPVKDLTLEQLQKLKVYHLVEGRSHEMMFNDEDLDEHQPFPTLKVLLKVIDPHVGFNVELKWNMELDDGTFELNNPFDMNIYVDKVLEIILKRAGNRRIIFSCFNPDICTMVRNKQNKYPVMFLTQGVTAKYQSYRDPRCLSIPAAVQNAVSANILGIVVHTEDLLRDPTQVKLATNAGLVIFCWGDDNNDKNTIKKLKLMGLHAVIYDKLDQYSTKEIKESVFLVEARESERELIQMAQLETLDEARSEAESSASSASAETAPRAFLDLRVREALQQHSTITSLESLASSTDMRERDDADVTTTADADVVTNASADRTLKRPCDLIASVAKELQLKQQSAYFRGIFPAGDVTKKNRTE